MEQKKQRKPKHPAIIYLNQYKAMKLRREDLVEELEYIRQKATKATSRITAERVSGTGMHDSMANAVIKGIETEEKLARLIANLEECLNMRLWLIEQLADEWEKTVLTERYINGRSWEDIQRRIPFERAETFRIHSRALQHFWKLHNDQQKVDAKPDTK